MAKTTYHVIACMKNGYSIMAETDDPSRTLEQVLRTAYDRPVEEVDYLDDDREPLEYEQAPICTVHNVPMVRVQGHRGDFWSCHQKNADGSWCSYRPDKG